MLFNPGLICADYTAPDGAAAGPDDWMKQLLPSAGAVAAGAVPAEAFSPIHHVDAADPPALILHGAADETVPPRSVRLFVNAARRAGVRCELALFPGSGHGFFNPDRRGKNKPNAYAATLRLADEFLTGLGDTVGPPPPRRAGEAAYELTGR